MTTRLLKISSVLVLVLSTWVARADNQSIQHVFQDGETLWFLSQIYYGDGSHFEKILKANQLASSEKVPQGRKLKIPSAIYRPEQPGFDLRLSYLRDRRAEALAKRSVASDDGRMKTVVVPVIHPPKSGLPIFEIHDTRGGSPSDKAKAELGGK